jgi:putative FmdB family regulatory protein
MPLYEFQCESCHKVTERIQKYSDPPMETCPACGGPVKKLLSSPAIQFKGTGWYITDYARKSSNGGKPRSSSDSADTGEKADKAEKADKGEKKDTSAKSEKSDTKADSTSSTKSDT